MSLFGNPNEGIFGDTFDYDHNGELDAMEQAAEMATLDWLLSGGDDGHDEFYEEDSEDFDEESSDDFYELDEEESEEDDESFIDWL